MKLITYSRDQSVKCGILADDGIIDIQAAWQDKNGPQTQIPWQAIVSNAGSKN